MHYILGILVAALTLVVVIGILAASFLGGTTFDRMSGEFGNSVAPVFLLGSVVSGLMAGMIVLIAGGLLAVLLYAFGESIFVLLALEENTRTTNLLLQRQLRLYAPAPQAEQEATEPESLAASVGEAEPVLAVEGGSSAA